MMMRSIPCLAGTDLWVSTSNALAAHLWPIFSALLKGEKHPPPPPAAAAAAATATADATAAQGEGEPLVPLSVVVNSRRQLQMPGHYCGNVRALREMYLYMSTHQHFVP